MWMIVRTAKSPSVANWRLILCMAVQLAVLGCVPPGGTVTEDSPSIAVLSGTFGAEKEDCPWLLSGGKRTYLLLPPSLTLRLDSPPTLVSGGAVVAKAGDEVRVTGPTGPLQGGVSACSSDPPFAVDMLERIGP